MRQVKIPKLKGQNRYWFVRAGKEAEFCRAFNNSDAVAIGHLDSLLTTQQDRKYLSADDASHYRELYKNSKSGKSKSSVSNVAGQIDRFIRDVDCRDILICPSNSGYMIGVVNSPAYLCSETLSSGESMNESLCSYQLRRDVQWSKMRSKETAPLAFARLFKNPSTIFEITKNRDLIDKWLLPLHIDEHNDIVFSCRLTQKSLISNRDSTKFSLFLDDLEAASFFISQEIEKRGEFSSEDIAKIISDGHNHVDYNFKLTTQQAFMSPGDIFTRLPSDNKLQAFIFALLISAAFQCEPVFSEETEQPKISKLVKQEVFETSRKIAQNNSFNHTKDSLGLAWRNSEEVVFASSENTFPEARPSTDTPM
ncbi:MAG: hypothetical protein DSY85_09230 [Marinomonas sp.]|nr:MAG: hypothetical protein DSY85_09230 [Marinomonas sp.]